MENLSGQNIKGYELRERIGAGGFGAVYKAYQSTVGRDVAMKIILPGYASHPDFIRRFETEAQLIARLEHPYITPLYDYWRDPEGAYLIMRYLRGGCLRDVLQNGPLDLETASLLLDQVCAALTIAHRNNVIHRDIKPGNILMDEDGNAYLADFGIAKDLRQAGSNTQADAIIGSLDYLSPEQARSEPVTPRTDIYSLGVVMYEALVGRHPFHGFSTVERLYKHINDTLPEITDLDPSVSESINRVIQKATAKNPVHRYAEALEFAAAFREAAGLNRTPTAASDVELLTLREQEVLKLVMDGCSNKEIAARLYVTVPTVKWYLNEIYRKLRVRSRVQAIVRARELNLVVNGASASVSIVNTTQLPEPENPYKGLRAFQSADERDFFGREDLVKQLLIRMSGVRVGTHASPAQDEKMYQRFLAIVGPSGSGKSSLVKAGLIPALWRGELPNSEKWFVVEMLPGARPLDELEVALTKIAKAGLNLSEHLNRNPSGLLRAAQLILPNDDSELVVVIDQFEEVFTLTQDEAERIQLLNLLQAAVTDPRSRVRVVITLRADYYDRPLQYPDFGDVLRNRMETILPLSVKGLERAIAGPAERVGVTFEEGLVAQIVSDMNYQAGALPLLQYALTELFEQRTGRVLTHEAYHQIGGAVGALARRAEAIYEELSPESQAVARQIFLRLVTLGEGAEDTRRRTTRSELLAIGGFTPHLQRAQYIAPLQHASGAGDLNGGSTPLTDLEQGPGSELTEDILDTYAAYRLLTLDTDPGTREPTVEVAHEAILREWERLRNWLNESRADIRQQRLLSYAAGEWNENKRDGSFLLMGSRLEQFEGWMGETQLALTPLERDYLAQSLKERERQQIAENERQAREAALEKRAVRVLRALVAVMAIALLGAFGLTGFAFNERNEAQSARATSDVNLRQSDALRLAAESNRLITQSGDSRVSALLAIRSLNTVYTSQGDEAILGASTLDYPLQQFVGHTNRVKAADYSPDGRYVLTGSGDSTVRLWDVQTGQEIRQFAGDMEDINSAGFSSDGKTIVTGSRYDHTVRVWDVNTGAELKRFTDGNSGAFSLDGQRIFIYSEETQTSQMIDLASGDILHTIEGQKARRPEVTGYSSDGSLYVATSPDNPMLRILKTQTEEEVFSMPLPETYSGFVISNDNRYFAINGEDSTIAIYDLESQTLLHSLVGHTDAPISMVFSQDSRLLTSGGADRTVIVWDVQSGQEIQSFNGHTQAVRKVAFSPDGRYVLSGSFDQRALLWEINPSMGMPYLANGDESVWFVAYSDDRNRIATATESGAVTVWNAQNQTILYTVQAGDEAAWFADFTGDGAWLITQDGANHVRIWDGNTGEFAYELESVDGLRYINTAPGSIVMTMHDSTDDWTGGVILWDATTGNEIQRFETPFGPDYAVMSPDGAHLAIFSLGDDLLRLLDMNTGEEKYVWELTNRVDTAGIPIGFSPDSRTIFAGTGTGESWMRDMQTGELIHTFIGHHDRVSGVVFSPDSTMIATAGADNTIRLWDKITARELRRITLPFAPVNVDFSADEQYLLVLGNDQIQFVNTTISDTVQMLCSRLSGDFTSEERSAYLISDNAPTCPKFASN